MARVLMVVVLAALALVTPSEAKLRILALHGIGGVGRYFCNALNEWDKSLLDLVEFHCINAPYRTGYTSYSWSDPSKTLLGGTEKGIAKVLNHIRYNDRYDGIFGFSQGGIVAGAVSGIIERRYSVLGASVPDSKRPRFLIVHEGGLWDGLPGRPIFATPLRTPSFHVVGTSDYIREFGVMLASKYSNSILKYLNMGHGYLTPQYMTEDFKRSLIRFLNSMSY